jgi:ribosomal protein L21
VETVVETDAVAAVDTAEETEVETDAVAETVVETDAVAAVDTVEETEVETDAVAAATVVITIDAHKATTQIIVMQRENAQGTLTIGDQTTSNRRRTTDTTIDWGLTT